MESVAAILLLNAAGATALAAAVLLSGRLIERPAIIHALWVVVLLKLLVPPLFEVVALPNWARPGPPASSASPVTGLPTAGAPVTDGAIVTRSLDWGAIVGAAEIAAPSIWLVGALVLFSLLSIRAVRFQRLLSRAPSAPPRIMTVVERLARAMGLSSPPRVRMICGGLPPMIWSGPSGCELLLPVALMRRLESRELEALVAHELGHIRRRDHWVRYLETAAMIVFWWNPLVPWARRRLRVAEECACDALVLRTLPAHGRAYALGLLKTLELVAGGTARVPALATGALETRQIKERLQMIVNQAPPAATTPLQRRLLAAIAVALLLVLPTWADREPSPPAAEDDRTEELLEIKRQKVELEQALREISARELALARQLETERSQVELEAIRAESARVAAEGREEEARRMQLQAEKLAQVSAMASEDARMRLELIDATSDLKLELDRMMIEVEEARARGDDHLADSIRGEADPLKRELTRAAEAERAYAAQLDATRALEHKLQEHLEQGGDAEAEVLREELIRLKKELARREADEETPKQKDREPGNAR